MYWRQFCREAYGFFQSRIDCCKMKCCTEINTSGRRGKNLYVFIQKARIVDEKHLYWDFFSKVCSLQRSCYKLKVYFSACRLLHVFIITVYSKHIEFDDIILIFKWKWNWLEGESFHFWDFSINTIRMGIRWDALRNWRIKTIMCIHIVKKLSGRRNRNLNYFQPADVP